MKYLNLLLLPFLVSVILSDALAADKIKVMKFKGKIKIDERDIVREGQEFVTGSKIEVLDEQSFVQLVFPDDSIVLMKKGVGKFRNDQRSLILDLFEGSLFTYVRNKEAKTKLTVKTPVASLGVRGTKYFISHSKNESYLCVCDGVVEAKNLTTGTKLLVEKNKDLYLAKKRDEPVTEANSMMMDMAKQGFTEMGFPVE
jgi:hypothetical protein